MEFLLVITLYCQIKLLIYLQYCYMITHLTMFASVIDDALSIDLSILLFMFFSNLFILFILQY